MAISDFETIKNEMISSIITFEMTEEKLIEIWNDMCIKKLDDRLIHSMKDLNSIFIDWEPKNLIKLVTNSPHFDTDKDYFAFDKDELDSFDMISNYSGFIETELITYIIDYRVDVLENYINTFINTFTDKFHNHTNIENSKDIIQTMIQKGFLDIIKDDWNKLAELLITMSNINKL